MIETFKMLIDNFGTLGALLVACGLIIFLLNKMRNGSKIDNVQGGLYGQLKEQLETAREEMKELKAEVKAVYEERNKLREDLVGINIRISNLEACEEALEALKSKLNEKDNQISEHIVENRNLMREILQLKDRIHHLELRLSQDEKNFCKDCQR